MRGVFLLFFAVLSFSISNGQDRSLFEKRIFVNEKGDTLRYRFLYPEKSVKKKSYPLVLYLHGSGSIGTDNEAQLNIFGDKFLNPINRKKFPAYAMFPQCSGRPTWSKVPGGISKFTEGNIRTENEPSSVLQLVIDVMDKIINEENVDISRIYIMGPSLGGFGTFDALAHFPEKFAAAVPVCGGGDASVVNRYARNTALWIFHGDADPTVSNLYSREMYEALKKAGAKVKYTEYPGVKHNSWVNAFEEKDLFKWMFRQRKN
jgi:predicted peptidase